MNGRVGPRWGWVITGGLVSLVGLGVLLWVLTDLKSWPGAVSAWLLSAVGWGLWLNVLAAIGPLQIASKVLFGASVARATLGGAAAVWLGMALLGRGLRRPPPPVRPLTFAAQAPLYAPVRKARDLYWGTLMAYGAGILGAELCVVFVQTFLAGGRVPTAFRLSPTAAFGLALGFGSLWAFVAGCLGAARSGRLSGPEATLGFIYFGLPLPLFLTALSFDPMIGLHWSIRFREVMYVAALLGRPELGFWLTYSALVLAQVLGMTTGFVATGSGRLDLKVGFELFVARRHVSIFRPSLLLGALAVLLFGIIPPLLVFFMIRSAEEVVERTRIKQMGLVDPLWASEETHSWKQRAQTPTSMMTALSVGGVGVGVMALIIVLSVMSGFEADLKQKILGTNAHAVVLKYADPFAEYGEATRKIRRVPGVSGTSPFILNEVMLSSEGNIAGVMLKGIDPETIGQVSDLPLNIQGDGKIEWLAHPEGISERHVPSDRPANDLDDPLIERSKAPESSVLPGIIIGRELAHALRVGVGDRVNVVSPLGGELGPHGPTPRSRPFRIAGVFYSGMYEYDSKFTYISLPEAQTFFSLKGVTGVELKVNDVDDARRISRDVLDSLGGYPYRTKDWGEMNRNLFSALRLEKLVMGIILTIIVIVAAGLIVATVIMLVLEKRKEISVLKALGVPDAGIVKIFLAEGLQIGIAGGLLGLISGLAWCFFIERVGIKLDPEVYYIPSLPVRVEPLQTALAVIIAVLITYLASIYPALKASQVEPVEGLKAD